MMLLIIFSFMLSLVACLPGPPVNLASHATTTQPGGRKTYHNLAQFNFTNWILTEVCFECTRSSPAVPYDCSFKFHWNDFNSNTSASCNNPWNKWDGVSPNPGPINDEYFICDEHKQSPEIWQLKFYSITNDGLFELGLDHDFIDYHDFHPPEFSEFYAAPFVQLNLKGKDDYSIIYAAEGPVSVVIQGLTSMPMNNPPKSRFVKPRLVPRRRSLRRPS
ncbi:hypothetical protein PGQ11_015294 [Apiospora arundinis]|uniref:Uncharacterized protein n=1 Tax=Apiospora arundinis TaxID=335852 RepID=A0ABR2HLN9_9PEZI